MSFVTFVSGRYLRTRQKKAFISLITGLSIAGVSVGVMALIVVIAVMAGFETDLKSRIMGMPGIHEKHECRASWVRNATRFNSYTSRRSH